jgi:hypothetical protein
MKGARTEAETNEATTDEMIKIEFYGNYTKANRMWEKEFGDITMPLMVKGENENWINHPRLNVWIHNNKYEEMLGNKFALLPHGKVEQIAWEAIDTEFKNEKIELLKTHEAQRGHTKYWKFMSEKTFKVADRDDMRIGFTVRNGIGTGIGLGIDAFTFRLICKNGAVSRGMDIDAASIRHVGDIQLILKNLIKGIKHVMVQGADILNYYTKADKIIVGEMAANQLYQRISDLGETYLPSNWNIKTPEELHNLKKAGKFKDNLELITLNGTPKSLWETFNDITQKQRDRLNADRVSFPAMVHQQKKLHEGLFALVNTKRGVV